MVTLTYLHTYLWDSSDSSATSDSSDSSDSSNSNDNSDSNDSDNSYSSDTSDSSDRSDRSNQKHFFHKKILFSPKEFCQKKFTKKIRQHFFTIFFYQQLFSQKKGFQGTFLAD